MELLSIIQNLLIHSVGVLISFHSTSKRRAVLDRQYLMSASTINPLYVFVFSAIIAENTASLQQVEEDWNNIVNAHIERRG